MLFQKKEFITVNISIMSIIGMFTWQTIASTTTVRVVLEHERSRTREIDTALNRLEREISLAFLTQSTAASTAISAAPGSLTTYQTIFIGQDDGDMDRLFFTTKAHQQTIRDARECDQAEVTLWTEPNPEDGSSFILFHRETGRIDHEPDVGGIITPLLRNITRFELRYLDPQTGEWRDEWDSTGVETNNRLPRAVQMVINLQHEEPLEPHDVQETTHVRTIILETAPRITQSVLSSGQNGMNNNQSLGFGGLSR